MARTVGWIAQWSEMIADPDYKIGRPRQLYVGVPQRDVPAAFRRNKAAKAVTELADARAASRKQAQTTIPDTVESERYPPALSGHAVR
jgi:hypothetical protein